jgi:hypothetical protein
MLLLLLLLPFLPSADRQQAFFRCQLVGRWDNGQPMESQMEQ